LNIGYVEVIITKYTNVYIYVCEHFFPQISNPYFKVRDVEVRDEYIMEECDSLHEIEANIIRLLTFNHYMSVIS
jgi:hypothetical protein